MKKFCCAAAIAVVLSGCVSAPSKSLDSGSTLQGEHVVISQYAKPDFAAMTPGKAAFGVFGAVSMISAGNELVTLLGGAWTRSRNLVYKPRCFCKGSYSFSGSCESEEQENTFGQRKGRNRRRVLSSVR